MSNFDISGAVFNDQLRMLETTDPAHADMFNALFGQLIQNDVRSEERRVGKECRSRWSPYH